MQDRNSSKSNNQHNESEDTQVNKRYRNDLIIEAAKHHGYSKNYLADRTKRLDPEGKGLNFTTISRIFDGENTSVDSLKLVCDALGIDYVRLFDFNDLFVTQGLEKVS
jgi:hypothetical protein